MVHPSSGYYMCYWWWTQGTKRDLLKLLALSRLSSNPESDDSCVSVCLLGVGDGKFISIVELLSVPIKRHQCGDCGGQMGPLRTCGLGAQICNLGSPGYQWRETDQMTEIWLKFSSVCLKRLSSVSEGTTAFGRASLVL